MELGSLFETMFSRKSDSLQSDNPRVDSFYKAEPKFNADSFNTPLPKGTEIAYSNWKAINAPNDSGFDYDLQGAFLAGVKRDPETGHLNDKFKKPNHPTFSVHSKYATGKWAQYAGTWSADNKTYTPASILNKRR